MRYSRTKEQIFAGREDKARALVDNCKPRLPEMAGGCLFPRAVAYQEAGFGSWRFQLLPCGFCKTCWERAVRHETALCMSEVHTSDYAAFVTFTYADPADDAVLQAEAEADCCDMSLSPRERLWRVRNRAERANRRDDLHHVNLAREDMRAYMVRLNAAGRKQGLVALQAWRRSEVARRVADLVALHPRCQGETCRAFDRRVRSIRRAVRSEFYSDAARAGRYEAEQAILAREGFTVRAWRVGQYGGKTDRPHFHAVICFSGSRPKHWPQPVRGQSVFNGVHDLAWPHGFMQVDWEVSEKSARYVLRYMLTGMGKPRGVTSETPRARFSANWVIDPKTGEAIRPGYFVRPRKGGHALARKLGLAWANAGLFPGDFKWYAPGCRDQSPRYEVRNGVAVLMHNGRASIMSGSRRRVALLSFAEARGIDPRDLANYADRRDVFLQQSVDKAVAYFEEKQAKRDAFERADNAAYLVGRLAERKGVALSSEVSPLGETSGSLSEARLRASALASVGVSRVRLKAEEKRLSEALARDLVADERDFYRVRSAEADDLARHLSGQRVRALMPSWRVVSSAEQVAAFAAQVALAASGQLVWQEGAWVDLRAPP